MNASSQNETAGISQSPGRGHFVRGLNAGESRVADYTVKRIDEMEGAFGGAFKRARAELGVESFGMQVMDLPPNLEQFPEHDHAGDGQEEVYLLLRGSAEID